ncbi:MAG: hypothetical protein IKO11_02760 [Lachnospiraceae bacterium]|nr:hypothetical protein [Lachnospiraceae bacterium]
MNISVNFQEQQKNGMMPAVNAAAPGVGKDGEQKKSLFAGDMKLGTDPVRERLDSARKKAYKIVSDAFDADKNFERQMNRVREFAREQKDEKALAQSDRASAEKTIASLKEAYGVDPGSQEQKDLDWLMDYRRQSPEERLGDIEQLKKDRARAAGIEAGLTEYQSRMLEANEQLDHAQARIDEADAALIATRQAMTDAKTEKNKTHAMVDADEEAEEIMDAAERAVVGMVMNDAKDKLDEKLREEQEKAEEKKEEEEKQEKLEAEREEKKELREAFAEGSKEAVQEARENSLQRDTDTPDLSDVAGADPAALLEKQGKVNAQLDELKNRMALIDADLKGIKLDETV